MDHWLGDEAGARLLCCSEAVRRIIASLVFRGLCHRSVNIDEVWLRFARFIGLQLLNLAQPLVLQQIFDKVIGQQNLDLYIPWVSFSWLLVCFRAC